MNEKLKKVGMLSLSDELSKNEQKKILGGTGSPGGGGGTGGTNPPPAGTYTVCAWGTYYLGMCAPGYCNGHGGFVTCHY